MLRAKASNFAFSAVLILVVMTTVSVVLMAPSEIVKLFGCIQTHLLGQSSVRPSAITIVGAAPGRFDFAST